MDRCIPTDELLTGLRTADSGVRDLVGPPQTHLTRDEAALTASRACAAVGSKPPGNAAANSRGRARPATRCSRNPAPRRKPGAAQEKAGRGATGLVQVEVAADGALTSRLERAGAVLRRVTAFSQNWAGGRIRILPAET